MPRVSLHRLEIGERFPTVELKLSTGDVLQLPSDFEGSWTAFIIYRGDF